MEIPSVSITGSRAESSRATQKRSWAKLEKPRSLTNRDMTASFVKFNCIVSIALPQGDPVMIQTYLDTIFKGLVPLLYTLGCLKLLKKNTNVNWLIIGTMTGFLSVVRISLPKTRPMAAKDDGGIEAGWVCAFERFTAVSACFMSSYRLYVPYALNTSRLTMTLQARSRVAITITCFSLCRESPCLRISHLMMCSSASCMSYANWLKRILPIVGIIFAVCCAFLIIGVSIG